MPRRQPARPNLPPQETVQQPSATDPEYRALLQAESLAYTNWLDFCVNKQADSKEQLALLRRTYERKRQEREAYQPK